MTDKLDNYQDMSVYGIEGAERDRFIAERRECAVIWSTSDGWPVGVMHSYVWHEGHFWVTCTQQRKRVPALRSRPKSTIIVAGEDDRTVTAKTLARVHEPGNEQQSWFYRALAERLVPNLQTDAGEAGIAAFIARLESPDRVILEFEPVKWITFDGLKVQAHTAGRWQPGQPWSGGP